MKKGKKVFTSDRNEMEIVYNPRDYIVSPIRFWWYKLQFWKYKELMKGVLYKK